MIHVWSQPLKSEQTNKQAKTLVSWENRHVRWCTSKCLTTSLPGGKVWIQTCIYACYKYYWSKDYVAHNLQIILTKYIIFYCKFMQLIAPQRMSALVFGLTLYL